MHLLTFEPKRTEEHPVQAVLPGWGCTLEHLLRSNSSITGHYDLEKIQTFCDFPLFGFSRLFVGSFWKKSENRTSFSKNALSGPCGRTVYAVFWKDEKILVRKWLLESLNSTSWNICPKICQRGQAILLRNRLSFRTSQFRCIYVRWAFLTSSFLGFCPGRAWITYMHCSRFRVLAGYFVT